MDAEPWADDKLNRKADGEHIIEFLLERMQQSEGEQPTSYILNIDAPWGMGKTYFLDNLRLSLRKRGHSVAYVNAWQDDHSDDPLISVMSAIEFELDQYFTKSAAAKNAFNKSKAAFSIIAKESLKQAGFHLIKAATGIGVKTIVDALQTDSISKHNFDAGEHSKSVETIWEKTLEQFAGERLAQHSQTAKAITEFRVQTAKAVASLPKELSSPPFFVFVDELDRCRPLYAIKMLEEIKHLFAIGGVVFIVATDSEQLSHSVKAVYGSDFESRKYLRRFFDSVFVFPEVSRKEFIASLFKQHKLDVDSVFFHTQEIHPLSIFEGWAEAFALSNRDIQQCMDIVATFVTSWPHKALIEPIYLLCLIHGFYVQNDPKFSDLDKKEAEQMDLNKWSIPHLSYDSQTGHSFIRTVTAARLAKEVVSSLGSTLRQLYDSGGFFRQAFTDEIQRQYNGQLPTNTRSLMNEYRSRVRNAGRVID